MLKVRRIGDDSNHTVFVPATPNRLSPPPSKRAPTRSRAAQILMVALVAMIAASVLIANRIQDAADTPGDLGVAYATHYSHARSGVERVLAFGDGQAYATVAHDPTLSNPGEFVEGRSALSYRAARPVWSYATSLLSGADWGRIPWVMVALEILAVAFAVGALALILLERGVSAWFALTLLVMPGAVATTLGLTPEMLALGAGLLAVRAYERDAPGPAMAWMVLAVMSRDTMLLMSAALALHALWYRRNACVGWIARVAVVPGLALGAWWIVLRTHVGVWPTWGSSRNFGSPLRGLIDVTGLWSEPALQWFLIVVLVGLAVTAVVVGRSDPFAWVTGAFLGLAFLMGVAVWRDWVDWTRVLLPMQACALAVLVPVIVRRFTRVPTAMPSP